MHTIFDMDTLLHTPASDVEDGLVGTAEVVKGKFGKACRFNFAEESRRGYFTAPVNASAWDDAAGISFWLKGDGTPNWGGMELVDAEDPRLRYQCEFSLSSAKWQKITLPWGDFMPFLPFGDFLGRDGHRPSRIGNLRFGKQPWWFEWPAHSFTVDQVQLEPEIKVDKTDYTPVGDPLARFKRSSSIAGRSRSSRWAIPSPPATTTPIAFVAGWTCSPANSWITTSLKYPSATLPSAAIS